MMPARALLFKPSQCAISTYAVNSSTGKQNASPISRAARREGPPA